MLPDHLIRAKPVGIELKTITRQPLTDSVADLTQRRKGTSGDHGFVPEPMAAWGLMLSVSSGCEMKT
jgi:hypothetical protein